MKKHMIALLILSSLSAFAKDAKVMRVMKTCAGKKDKVHASVHNKYVQDLTTSSGLALIGYENGAVLDCRFSAFGTQSRINDSVLLPDAEKPLDLFFKNRNSCIQLLMKMREFPGHQFKIIYSVTPDDSAWDDGLFESYEMTDELCEK